MNTESLTTELRQLSSDMLGPLVQVAIEEAVAILMRTESDATLETSLLENRKSIRERFDRYLGSGFDALVGIHTRKIELGDYPSLSLVDEDFIEAANALEGMVNYARYTNINALIVFNARLNELFEDQTVDETNSPLDPDRIAEAFVDALAPLEVDQQFCLPIYRCFNQRVLHRLDELLQKADNIFIAAGVLPELVVDGSSREDQLKKRSSMRPTNSPMERAFSAQASEEARLGSNNSAHLYDSIRDLLWSTSEGLRSNSGAGYLVREVAVPTAAMIARYFNGSLISELGLMPLIAEQDMQVAGREVVIVSDRQLTLLLDHVQDRLIADLSDRPDLIIDFRRFTGYLGEELLESSLPGQLNAIDGESLDTILTINLLYEAFCSDVSLVGPIKELIAATQVVMMKMALDDPQLFSQAGHPARLLLNEVASAGVGGLDYEVLKTEPVFVKLESILIRLVSEYDGSSELVTELLAEFNAFRRADRDSRPAPDAISEPVDHECRDRINEIHQYVNHRIEERIKEPLHPLIDKLVRQHFHRFLVSLVQRDGQGSNSWMLVVKMMDLLLWTVRSDKQDSDRQRFEKFNSLLLPNIRKILLASGLDEQASDRLLAQVEQVQENSFSLWHESTSDGNVIRMNRKTLDTKGSNWSEEILATMANGPTSGELFDTLPLATGGITPVGTEIFRRQDLEQYLPQVDKLPVGSWLSFQMDGSQSLYCTLTARLPADDKLVFVNGKGVKVLEKTRDGLARELQQGSARIVSEWPLFERGMESVVARLRERQGSP